MDILKEIEQQIISIKKIDSSDYLDSILTHIERAELYYIKGKEDTNYFNDVIYRSNQAYEGALKEAYKVLAGKNDNEIIKKSPNEIEEYLEKKNIFKDRVLQLFKNYRQEWRNKSTHDHKLFFDENEAFIALTSVTSFVHLLLKQILERVAYLNQQKKLSEEKASTDKIVKIAESKSSTPVKKLIDLIKEFVRLNGQQIYNTKDIKELEILGLFHAYIETAGKNIITQREPLLAKGMEFIRPDFLVNIDNQPIILEFKKANNLTSRLIGIKQISKYMSKTNINKGVIYFPNFKTPNPIVEVNLSKSDETDYELAIVTS